MRGLARRRSRPPEPVAAGSGCPACVGAEVRCRGWTGSGRWRDRGGPSIRIRAAIWQSARLRRPLQRQRDLAVFHRHAVPKGTGTGSARRDGGSFRLAGCSSVPPLPWAAQPLAAVGAVGGRCAVEGAHHRPIVVGARRVQATVSQKRPASEGHPNSRPNTSTSWCSPALPRIAVTNSRPSRNPDPSR